MTLVYSFNLSNCCLRFYNVYWSSELSLTFWLLIFLPDRILLYFLLWSSVSDFRRKFLCHSQKNFIPKRRKLYHFYYNDKDLIWIYLWLLSKCRFLIVQFAKKYYLHYIINYYFDILLFLTQYQWFQQFCRILLFCFGCILQCANKILSINDEHMN